MFSAKLQHRLAKKQTEKGAVVRNDLIQDMA